MSNTEKVAVIGAGSWGTALAIHIARQFNDVWLWGQDAAHMQTIQNTRVNAKYLPTTFPPSLTATGDLPQAIQHCSAILIAVPSTAFEETLSQLVQAYPDPSHIAPIIYATKGLVRGQFLYQLIDASLPQVKHAVLSGPSFAKEVAEGLPTAVTIAARDLDTANRFVSFFHHHNLRVYTHDDEIGVALAGAYKNILAIATGISDGLSLGANARAALITRGLAEMQRLGCALGAKRETFMGLAGLGDLLLTATDNQSRNRRFGLLLGQGFNQAQALAEIGQVVEGANACQEIHNVAKQYQIELPIVEQVIQILMLQTEARQAVNNLLNRVSRQEVSGSLD